MARRGADRHSRIPRPLQPLVGSVVLVAAVRAVDIVWTRVTGDPPPHGPSVVPPGASPSAAAQAGAADRRADAATHVMRDRLIYALLLGSALRLARRAGLRDAKDL